MYLPHSLRWATYIRELMSQQLRPLCHSYALGICNTRKISLENLAQFQEGLKKRTLTESH
jgi:hypothetical protein